jgi:hypothetical protein
MFVLTHITLTDPNISSLCLAYRIHFHVPLCWRQFVCSNWRQNRANPYSHLLAQKHVNVLSPPYPALQYKNDRFLILLHT